MSSFMMCVRKRGQKCFIWLFLLWDLNKISEGKGDSLSQLFTWLRSSSIVERARINDQIVPDVTSSGLRGQRRAQKTL